MDWFFFCHKYNLRSQFSDNLSPRIRQMSTNGGIWEEAVLSLKLDITVRK